MKFEDLAPHLNKIATLYLKDNKRKVGWLFVDIDHKSSGQHLLEVYFVSLQKGRKLTDFLEKNDVKALAESQHHEKILLKEIVRVRSTK